MTEREAVAREPIGEYPRDPYWQGYKAGLTAARAGQGAEPGLREAWIEGWMQGAGQMTTWPPEALHSEAVRQYERRAALAERPETAAPPLASPSED